MKNEDRYIGRHTVHNNETKDKKRFYTRGTLISIRIPRLAKIPTLYRDWDSGNGKGLFICDA